MVNFHLYVNFLILRWSAKYFRKIAFFFTTCINQQVTISFSECQPPILHKNVLLKSEIT